MSHELWSIPNFSDYLNDVRCIDSVNVCMMHCSFEELFACWCISIFSGKINDISSPVKWSIQVDLQTGQMQSPWTTTNVPEMLAVHGTNIAYHFLGQWRLFDTWGMLVLFRSKSFKYLQNTFWVGARGPNTHPEKAFTGSKHLLARYLEDFGKTGLIVRLQAATGSKISWNQQKRHPSAGLCGPKCAHGALFITTHAHPCLWIRKKAAQVNSNSWFCSCRGQSLEIKLFF